MHAYGFAAASVADLWPNPIVARHVDVAASRIVPYPHWPNGFFLLLEAVLRIFGRTEMVGRWFALLLTVGGFALVAVSVRRDARLVYFSMPLLLMTAAARDSASFVFLDAALYFSIGLLLFLSGRGAGVFRMALVLTLFLNHLVAPYAAAIVLLRWGESRSLRAMLADAAALGAASAAVLVGLALGAGNFDAGATELSNIFRLNATAHFDAWRNALLEDLLASLNLGSATALLVAAAWLGAVVTRQWRVAILLPSFVLFSRLLPGYVSYHHFTRLPLVFFALVTLLAAVEAMLEQLGRRWLLGAGSAGVALALAVRLAGGTRQYNVDPDLQRRRGVLIEIVSNPAHATALQTCNAFILARDNHQFDPRVPIAQFFFGPRVVARAQRGEPVRTCAVDMAEGKLHGPLEPAEIERWKHRRH